MSNFQISPAFPNNCSRAIVFSINNNYSKYCAATIQSIIDHSRPDIYYDINIFETDISERNKKLLRSPLPENFSLRFFNISSVLNELIGNFKLKTTGYVSVEAYYRLLIPLVMRHYPQVLYIDSDICFTKSIDAFFNHDIGSNQIAVVIDAISQMFPHYKKLYKHLCDDLNLNTPEKYFNSGLILFNIQEINEDDYLKKFNSAIRIEKLDQNDQDVLNVIFQGNAFLYPNNFNTQLGALSILDKISNPSYKQDYLKALNNPLALHFTGARKPWDDPHKEFSEVFWHYERETPFYEECLLSSVERNYVSQTQLKNVNSKFKIYFRYLVYKFLKKFSSGDSQAEFDKRYRKYQEKVLDIKNYSKYK